MFQGAFFSFPSNTSPEETVVLYTYYQQPRISNLNIMVHIPSFLIGSIFSGTSFLLIHRELSHRTRLTTHWIVTDWLSSQFQSIEQELLHQKV